MDALTNSVATTYAHDAANRLVGIQYPENAASFDYNELGLRTAQSNAVAQVWYGYDTMGRLTVVTQSVASVASVVEYAYDLNGNRTDLAYPGRLNVNYAFDFANRLTQVSDWAQRQTAYSYDDLYRQIGIVYPNAATAAFAWDAASRLTGVQPISGNRCVMCQRCLSFCPENALKVVGHDYVFYKATDENEMLGHVQCDAD